MGLEGIVLNERSQTNTVSYLAVVFKKRELTETESRMVVAGVGK